MTTSSPALTPSATPSSTLDRPTHSLPCVSVTSTPPTLTLVTDGGAYTAALAVPLGALDWSPAVTFTTAVPLPAGAVHSRLVWLCRTGAVHAAVSPSAHASVTTTTDAAGSCPATGAPKLAPVTRICTPPTVGSKPPSTGATLYTAGGWYTKGAVVAWLPAVSVMKKVPSSASAGSSAPVPSPGRTAAPTH